MKNATITLFAALLVLSACCKDETAQQPVSQPVEKEKTVTETVKEKTVAAVEKVKEEAQPIVETVKEKSAPVAEQAKSLASETADKATDAASGMMNKMKEMATDAAVTAGVPVPLVDQHAPKAVGAIKAFAKTLQGELKAAMAAGGPVNAIDVCNTKANGIAQQLSQESGYNLSRVSMKNRHPNQEASGWNREVLDTFETRLSNGEDIMKLAYKAVVDKPEGGQQFRMMKAIPTGGVCLACHGETVAPEVEAKLSELYPGDKARGYKEGMIRGAFVVTKDLN